MRSRLILLLSATIVLAALAGGIFGPRVSARTPLSEETEKLIRTFTLTLAAVEKSYYRQVTTEELIEHAVRGLLRTLDPHSSFFATSDYNRLQEEQQGKYFGLGITIRAEVPGSGRVLIVEPPSPGTPAYKAGLKAGDVIARIEGKPIDDWDINEEVIPNLKGPKGTIVNITVERPGELEPLAFSVERDEIPLYTIKYFFEIRPRVGYIKIDKFSETTSRELDEALSSLGHDELQGLILDLRDNPGGALSQAIEVSDRFLDRGQVIVSTRSRRGKEHSYRTSRDKRYPYPMIVLINQSSASASEIVAGALQDHDRALIVGETSFGKALVQTIYPLEGNRGLALTTGKYYTPSDRLIQRDYSSSFYDYLYNRAGTSPSSPREHQTDQGRKVYSGGGIAPDVEIVMERPRGLGTLHERRDLFFEFASRLSDGKIQSDFRYQYSRMELSEQVRERLGRELQVTDHTVDLFKEFLNEKNVRFSEEAFEEHRELIRSRLKQELFVQLVSDKEGFRIAVEHDRQVQKALELLPTVQTLLQNGLAPDLMTP